MYFIINNLIKISNLPLKILPKQILRNKFKSTNTLKIHNKKFDKMIRIKFNQKESRVLISLKCKIDENSEREFNLNRSMDEEIGVTFEKLYSNYLKQVTQKLNNANKKQKSLATNETTPSSTLDRSLDEPMTPSSDKQPVGLYDFENRMVELARKNKDAWVENFTLRLKDQEFKVCINLPSIQKISLPKLIIAGMPTVVNVEYETEDGIDLGRSSIFKWYLSDTCFSENDKQTTDKKKPKSFDLFKVHWNLVGEDLSKRMCVLDRNATGRLVKVECIPNDGKREGVAVEVVSTNPIVEALEIEKMPMFERHKLTQNKLNFNL